VDTVAGVEKLAHEGKLRDLPGFGEKSEENILKAVEAFKTFSGGGRVRLDTATLAAEALVEHVKKAGEAVESVTPAGALRPRQETIGDIDLLVTMKTGRDKQTDIDAVAEYIQKEPNINPEVAT